MFKSPSIQHLNFILSICFRKNFDLKDFLKVLSEMALFFTYHINIDVDKWNMDVTFTVEEEVWLNNQMRLADNALRSVPIGPELIQEFLMFSLGVNFINILWAVICSFIYLQFVLVLFCIKKLAKRCSSYNFGRKCEISIIMVN